ncbi:uncharacterized protein KY384_007942 [Bacidia gigantensis]|uniref:uncharacterized protein n=1 Tax=Bacidia gigantensis TaxID=2732470 RepID=UPI001D0569CE|nr:uncharacterized protein KY384_007942 [Bacidia gigantensis]KAG8527788.1 hypothetical protein KY384_007942 [Bacidia gigantensis]
MPLTAADQQRVEEYEARLAASGSSKIAVRVPGDAQKLGITTVVCLILNRTIGAGIYVSPALVLRATNSTGVSLVLWVIGAIFGVCGVLIWLEFGLNVPKYEPSKISPELCSDGEGKDGPRKGVPRNGGEKNYLEFVYEHPQFRTTCLYGFSFVILGNLAGNAIACGMYIMRAAGLPDHNAAIRALAVVVLSLACILHGSWRQAGIVINNVLAGIKVLMLVAVIIIGFAAGGGASLGGSLDGKAARKENFGGTSFDSARGNVSDYSAAILLICYSFSGFKQPFYMLSEVAMPKKKFAITTISTTVFVGVLFFLANVAYLCAIKKGDVVNDTRDMAIILFQEAFGNEIAPRVMSGMIALSVLGNIVVMTFTASRVKQEIAKEGILPFSSFFARSTVTPYARLHSWLSKSDTKEYPEESPAAALLLHWIFAVFLVGATSSKPPSVAYPLLIELYSYVLVLMVGLGVSTGIILLHWCSFRDFKKMQDEWKETSDWTSWASPAAAVYYATICGYLIITLFLTPSDGSVYSYSKTHIPSYVIPTVGLSTLLMGYTYYLIFTRVVPRIKKATLIVERDPIIVRQGGKPNGAWVLFMEGIDFWWASRSPNVNAA